MIQNDEQIGNTKKFNLHNEHDNHEHFQGTKRGSHPQETYEWVDKGNGYINENALEKQFIKLTKYLHEGKQLTLNEPRGKYNENANMDRRSAH
jgi:hypothetical protein